MARGKKILIVDDHEGVRECLCDLLEAAGFRVAAAEGGLRALHYLDGCGNEAPDLIVLDYRLYDMSGREFLSAKSRRASVARTPVIVVSADADARAAAAAAGYPYMKKPVDLEDFLATCEREATHHA